MLALAHYIERLVEKGKLKSYADAARRLGITRPRMTQVMRLLDLSRRIQHAILFDEIRFSERRLRRVLSEPAWGEQESRLPI